MPVINACEREIMEEEQNIVLKRYAAQCIMPKIETDLFFNDKDYKEKILQLVRTGVSGFCVFGGDISKCKEMTSELQQKAEIPLIFSADFEHGLPMRLSDGTSFPHALSFGRTGSPDITFDVAKAIAIESLQAGINMNLAPVCDIFSNKDNPIINIRSFGETPEEIIPHIISYINGTQSENLIDCAKHFPGHGDTDVDSHNTLPIVKHSLERFRKFELMPFTAAIKAGVKSIMIGHLAVPELEPSGIPSSQSYEIITGLLRNELKYTGLIITDALDMSPISNEQSSGLAAFLSIKAGANIALMPTSPEEAINYLYESALSDNNFSKILEKSFQIIINTKKQTGLYNKRDKIGSPTTVFAEHEKLALLAAYKSIKIIGDSTLVPVSEEKRIAGFALILNEDINPGIKFFKYLAEAIENDADFGFIDDTISDSDILSLKEQINDTNLLIIALFLRTKTDKLNPEYIKRLKYIINTLAKGKQTITIQFGNPYMLKDLNVTTTLATYSDSLAGIAATIYILCGRNAFQ